jgi:hypothetical protein
MNHDPKWNAAKQEWFCMRCLHTSDHISKHDAELELANFKCSPPQQYTEFS